MQKILFLKGLPASGKSSYAKELLKKEPGIWKRVNKDDLRAMLDNGKWSKQNETFLLEVRDFTICNALLKGYNVVVDDTNFAEKHYQTIQKIAQDFLDRGHEIKVETKFFDVDLDECIARDLKRPVSVGAKVIKDMYNQYLRPKAEEVPYAISGALPDAVICDIDGTLAHMKNRGPFEWSRVGEDAPNVYIIALVIQLFYDTYHPRKVILFSGRDAICRDETVKWLADHGVPFHELHMRAIGDTRKDSIVKRELYDKYIKGKYDVELVLDDRNQVVDMWRHELGLTCLQVAEGDF